jgi:hypothetical protein
MLALIALLAGCGGSSSPEVAPLPATTRTTPAAKPSAPIRLATAVAADVRAGASARAYVRRVDSLLEDSGTNTRDARAFVSDVWADNLSPAEALDIARSILAQGETNLHGARALTLPPAFRRAQLLLENALQLRVAQQRAIVASGKQRYDNPLEGWQGRLSGAGQIGQRATALERQFLAAYGAVRQKLVGLDPSSLPASF